jgi:hypothetical protein
MKNAVGAVVAIATIGGLGYLAYCRYMTKVLDAGTDQVVKGMANVNVKNNQVIHLGHTKE